MNVLPSYLKATARPLALLTLVAGLSVPASLAHAQMPMSATQSQQQPGAAATEDTQAQITALQQKVIKLQAALKQSRTGNAVPAKSGMAGAKPAMGMGENSGGMGGMAPDASNPSMGDDTDAMESMPSANGKMKGKTMKPMGCCGMSMGKPMPAAGGMADDKMGGMSGGRMAPMEGKGMAGKTMADASSQESPHLLHIGAEDFFLDHQKHINITSDQKMQLEKLKNDANQQKMTSQTRIDQSEQDLWQLTSADQPNTTAIDSKVQEIAKLRADQQIQFIHSVSMASDVLTPEQRAQVVMPMSPGKGMKKPMAKEPMTAPMKME